VINSSPKIITDVLFFRYHLGRLPASGNGAAGW